MNYYIDKYSPLILDCKTLAEYRRVYFRISAAIGSIILGRGFNQTLDEYLADKPVKQEFFKWWMEINNDLHIKGFGKPLKPAQ